MQTSDKLFAQNWIEQFREDYYGPAGNMDCPIMDAYVVRTNSSLDSVIMDCLLRWMRCGDRLGTWSTRYDYPFGRIALSR